MEGVGGWGRGWGMGRVKGETPFVEAVSFGAIVEGPDDGFAVAAEEVLGLMGRGVVVAVLDLEWLC